MKFGAVALVLVETIFGKLLAEVTHDPVARHFRDHARRGNRQAIAIAIDDRGLRKRKWKNGKAVDEHVFWRKRESGECDPHRLMRRAQNVDPIDLEMINNADGPRDLGVGKQLVVNLIATFRRKLF